MTDELLALVGPDLREDVARCAAAAGYRIRTAPAADCRRDWLRAGVVIVDVEAIRVLAGLGPPGRDGVIAVTDREPAEEIRRSAVNLGADHMITLPADEARLVGVLTGFRSPSRGLAGALALIGGHGGAGATTLAAAVAAVASESSRVLVLDVAEYGAGIDLALGIEGRSGLRWQDLTLEGGAVRASSLHRALPQVNDNLSVLCPQRDNPQRIGVDAVTATMDAARVDGDLVVVDLPRTFEAVTNAVLDSVDLVVLVTTASLPGVAASRRVAARIAERAATAEVAVRGPAPSGLRAVEVADAIGLPLITAYRADPALPSRMESGRIRAAPRSPLGRAARTIRGRIGTADRPAA